MPMVDGTALAAPALSLGQRLQRRWRRLRSPLDVPGLASALAAGLDLDGAALPDTFGALDAASDEDPQVLAREVRRLMAQPQVRQQWLHRLIGASQGEPGPQVVSLGTHCYTSALLRRWGWRTEAGPVDWLFSSVPMIAHLLDDDFDRFLRRDEYRPVPLEQRFAGPQANRVNHAFYQREFGIEHVFNHHDVHLDPDYERLQRRVERFRRLLRSEREKCFLVFRWYVPGLEDELPGLHAALARRTRNFQLMVFDVAEPPPGQRLPVITPRVEKPYAAFLVEPVSQWAPLWFPSVLDEHALHHVICGRLAAARQPAPSPAIPT